MMGERRVIREALFYGFSLEQSTSRTITLLRKIDRFVDLSGVRRHLEPYYSETGRPSIDPELMIRMLIVGYCFGIRSERRLCEEVHLNLCIEAQQLKLLRLIRSRPRLRGSGAVETRQLAGSTRRYRGGP